uniref:Chaperone protein htpG n=1 Tax=Lygus hesperus TaxID=30085 RepID=A0A0A9Y2U8_LYGHE
MHAHIEQLCHVLDAPNLLKLRNTHSDDVKRTKGVVCDSSLSYMTRVASPQNCLYFNGASNLAVQKGSKFLNLLHDRGDKGDVTTQVNSALQNEMITLNTLIAKAAELHSRSTLARQMFT